MTILELKYKYGTKEFQVSKGTTLTELTRHLYGSDDIRYKYSIIKLNTRYDWSSMDICTIQYFDKLVCDQLDEIW
jgi:hypothetical protein